MLELEDDLLGGKPKDKPKGRRWFIQSICWRTASPRAPSAEQCAQRPAVAAFSKWPGAAAPPLKPGGFGPILVDGSKW
jgi:hypothetical protein